MLCHICQQVAAVFAADAVSRLSGTVGVAAVTAGPGTIQCSYYLVHFYMIIYTLQMLFHNFSARACGFP